MDNYIMSQIVNHSAIEYEPDWNEETQQFEDISPFQANRRSNTHVCYCKNLQGECVYLKNKSQFDAHVLTGYHKKALHQFVIQKMILLKKELDRSNKEKAALYVWVESEIARERRTHSEIKYKIEQRLAQAEELLRFHSEETANYFTMTN